MCTTKLKVSSLEAPPAVAAVRRINDGFKAFQVLRAAYRSGLFDWLDRNGPAERAAIAAALGLRGAHLAGFLQSLEDLGLVTRQGTQYALAKGMDEVLVAASPWCQAPAIEAMLEPRSAWPDLCRFLSEDWQPAPACGPASPRLHPFLDEARLLAVGLAARENERCSGPMPRQLLCFDGSGGLAATAICLAQPALSVSVVVAPDAVQRATDLLDDFGLSSRCLVYAGSPLQVPVQASYDRVVLFHALYGARKSMGAAFTSIAGRLAAEGELCSAHWFCLEACETAPGGLRDLDRAVLTDSHPLCHVESFGDRFVAAGLHYDGGEDIEGPYGHLKLHFASRTRDAVGALPASCCAHC